MSQILSLIQKKLLNLPTDYIETAYGGNHRPYDELINTDIKNTPISDMPMEKAFLLKATRSISEDWVVKERINRQNLVVRGFVFPDGVSFLVADDNGCAVGLGTMNGDDTLRFSAFKGEDSFVFDRTVRVETACAWVERFIDALVDGTFYANYESIEDFFKS